MIVYAIRFSWVCGMIRKRPKLFGSSKTTISSAARRGAILRGGVNRGLFSVFAFPALIPGRRNDLCYPLELYRKVACGYCLF